MKAFVTGSTGLVGSNLTAALVAQGHTVKALARSAEKARRVFASLNPGVEIVTGDMEDLEAFVPHLAGCDVLFHTAAYFTESFNLGDHWPKLERINVQGTLRLLEAAEQAGVRKVIYVSSGAIIGNRPDGSPGDETCPPSPLAALNPYFRSKIVADQAIMAWQQTHTLPVVHILPTAIFGPGDSGPTGAGRLIVDFVEGKLPFVPPGGFLMVDVRDVAQAMLSAVENGRSGERYIIHNRYATIAELFALVSQITGVPVPRLRAPYAAARLMAHLSEFGARLTGQPPMVTVNALRALTMDVFELRTDKARRELGLSPRPLEDTLRAEIAWFAHNGYLSPARGAALMQASAGQES